MGRHEPHEGYYEDDDEEFFEDEEAPRFRQRVLAVFGTSYGISFLVHMGLLLVLMTIVIAAPVVEEVQSIVVRHTPPRPPEDPQAEIAEEEKPEIDLPTEELPVVDLMDEPEPIEPPKGDPLHQSNKKLDSYAHVDAIAVGPGAAAGRYGRADGIGRVGKFGGSKKTVHDVLEALRWLRDHQSPDGSWDADGWKNHCKRGGGQCKGPGADLGAGNNDVGVSSLALLAFMGQGSSDRHGRFKRVVKRGMRWLVKQQRADGSLGGYGHEHSGAYNHAIATMALCEAWGVGRNPRFRAPAQRAVDLIVSAQNPGLGWRYGIRDGQNDTSVTGWMVLALKAARVAGLEVPQSAFDGALAWVNRATASNGVVGYQNPGGGSSVLPQNDGRFVEVPTMTAVGVVCRVFGGERRSNDAVKKGVRILVEESPRWDAQKVNYYYWYYGTYAVFHSGEAQWDRWNEAMKSAIQGNQRRSGCERGSWDGLGEWCVGGGRVYATAINALTLQIYYRYKRQRGA